MFKWIEKNKLLRRLADGAFVPADPDNSDYQGALAWVAAGNTIPDPDPPSAAQIAETARLAALDDQITGSAILNNLKAMTNTQFDTWWAANVTNLAQVNVVIKLLTRVILRRVL